MISKNSFWVNLRENNKRRIWVWILSFLSFILLYPAYTAICISRVLMRHDMYVTDYGLNSANQMLQVQLLDVVKRIFGFGEFAFTFACILAVLSAIQGFSYLYSRKKIDFYHGLPIKRNKRFLVIWLNGILLFVIPYLLGLFISFGIAAMNGGVNILIIKEAVVAFFVILGLYFSVYHMTILAVMLTGNVTLTCLGFAVFCLYELLARQVIRSLMETFFRYYPYYGSSISPLLSPFSIYLKMVDEFQTMSSIGWKIIIEMMLFICITGILSYVCFKKRHAEAAGKAIAFSVIKPLIKIPVTVLFALISGVIILDVIEFEFKPPMAGMGYIIFTMAVAVIMGSCFIQVVYESDIRGALHKKTHIIVSGVLTALIFLVFRYDLIGYDSYIPNPENVESVAFIPMDYESAGGYGNARFDEKGNHLTEYEYGKRYMQLKDAVSICRLAEISMRSYNEVERQDTYYSKDSTWSSTAILYRMKNGREVNRQIWIDTCDTETIELLDRVMGTDEFREGTFIGTSDFVERLMADNEKYKVTATYGNMVYSNKLLDGDVPELLAAYKLDMKKSNFTLMSSQIPVGYIKLELQEVRKDVAYGYYSQAIGFGIYPFFENSIAFLKEKGYYMDYQLNPDDVDRIQVVNYNTKLSEQSQAEDDIISAIPKDDLIAEWEMAEKYGYGVDTRTYANYTNQEDIEKIAACVYPDECFYPDWDHGDESDSNYEVIVYFKTDSTISKEYGMNAYYGFINGQTPEFVKKDTMFETKKIQTSN